MPSSLNLGGGLSIELLGQRKSFLGLGAISHGDVELRSGRRPMFVEIRNPSAVELLNYRVTHCENSPEKVLLRFSMEMREGGLMEWMVHEVRPRYNTADWTQGPKPAEHTILELELRPVRRNDRRPRLLRFFLSLSLPKRSRFPSTRFWTAGAGRSVEALSATSSGCGIASCRPSCASNRRPNFTRRNGIFPIAQTPARFSLFPSRPSFRGSHLQASPAGVLVTWASEVAHIRSLFEKPRGEEVMTHFHEHCGDLGNEFSTAPIEVLWSPGQRSRVELANDYEAVRELVHETLHAQIGMRRERVTTFGHIEEWTPADLERYRSLGLPKLLGAGTKTICLANHFENNMNTWGVSNFCVTVDYKVADSVGEERLRAFCDDARAAGATVQMWGNTAISTLNLLFDNRVGDSDRIRFLPREGSIMEALDRNTSFVRNASNAIEADHYTPDFAVLNLRDPAVREYWLRRWEAAHDKIGLGSIFLDSSFNLSSDKFHYVQNTRAHQFSATPDQGHLLGFYRPASEPPAAILSQYRAHLDLMAAMQRIGYVYGNEDLGVFGIHRHGPAVVARLDSLFMWADCVASFDVPAIRRSGHEPDDIYFRGLAYRMMWTLHWDVSRDVLSFRYGGAICEEDVPGAQHIALLHAYNEVEPAMRKRTIFPEEAGVLYRSESMQVLWAFRDLSLPVKERQSIREVLTGEVIERPPFAAKKNRVYLIESPV